MFLELGYYDIYYPFSLIAPYLLST